MRYCLLERIKASKRNSVGKLTNDSNTDFSCQVSARKPQALETSKGIILKLFKVAIPKNLLNQTQSGNICHVKKVIQIWTTRHVLAVMLVVGEREREMGWGNGKN